MIQDQLEQLSFDVVPRLIHTADGERPAEVEASELKIQGDLRLDINLQHGDEVMVTVTDADGSVIAQHHAEVSAPPSFVPIEDKDSGLVGYVRSHKAKIGDRA